VRRRSTFVTIVVGKNSLLREGLATILRSANFRILASVSSTDDLVACKLRSRQTLFLIVHTGSGFDAVLEQIAHLRNQQLHARIVIVADRYRLAELVAAVRAGANGYFVDILSCDVLIRSLELVTLAQTAPAFVSFVLGPEDAQVDEQLTSIQNVHDAPGAPADAIAAPQLSNREKSVLRCLIEGGSNKSIARQFDIAEATVKVHVKAILRKIQVQNRTQAAVWAMNNQTLNGRANTSSTSSVGDFSNPLRNAGGLFSETNKIGASAPLAPVDPEQNGAVAPQVPAARLIGKTAYPRTHNRVPQGRWG
jgi:DNA-binding NarL/FixJ family response regulator